MSTFYSNLTIVDSMGGGFVNAIGINHNSISNINGGTIGKLEVYQNGTANVNSGTVNKLTNNGRANINGGTIIRTLIHNGITNIKSRAVILNLNLKKDFTWNEIPSDQMLINNSVSRGVLINGRVLPMSDTEVPYSSLQEAVAVSLNEGGEIVKYYSDLSTALEENATKIKLLENVDTLNITQDKALSIDLNGKTVATLENSGTVTIEDTATGGAVTLNNSGMLTINGGTVTLNNSGTANITGGKVKLISDTGTINKTGGTILQIHPICGKTCTHEGEAHANIEWQPLPEDFAGGQLNEGNYYLTKDVNLTSEITIASGATVNLCLNGFNLDGQNSCRVIVVNGTFNLTDCTATVTNGAYTAGTIRNGKGTSSNYGGGVYVESTFNMYDGIITNNTATNGGGVYVSGGTFNMHGGSITNNTANASGSGVCVVGNNVTLYGGRIVNNMDGVTQNNIYLNDGYKINLGQTMAEGSLFGICNTGEFANACDTDHSQYFFSDGGNKVLYTADKTLAVEVVDNNVEIKGDMIISKAAEASVLVVASYDESGKLIDTKLIDIAAETVDRKTIAETGISTQNAKTVKAMLWESLVSAKPLAPFVEKTYTSQTNE